LQRWEPFSTPPARFARRRFPREPTHAMKLPEDTGWAELERELDTHGAVVVPGLADPTECDELAHLYDDGARFRKRIVMAQHAYGQGEYKYFAYPLPAPVAHLRQALYPGLARIANRWQSELGLDTRFPDELDPFLERCHAAGQTRPTPLMLQYTAGDYNRLHQDVYGDHVFPLQVVLLLSAPQRDFDGGEFVLTEQRARMQSRPLVLPLAKGDAAIIPVRERPVASARGRSRVQMRHGVSRVRSGSRRTLGILFHDAS